MLSRSSSTSSISSNHSLACSVFVCGFVGKRWHNSSLKAIMADLAEHHYVSCNASGDFLRSQKLLKRADCMLFFVNEHTLADATSLLALQQAWHLEIPILMLRPPRTRLVVKARGPSRRRTNIMVNANGAVLRSSHEIGNGGLDDHGNVDEAGLDYALLQDILYEGYRIAVVYDRADESRCMAEIRTRVARATASLHHNTEDKSDKFEQWEEDDEDDLEESDESHAINQRSWDSCRRKLHRRPATPYNMIIGENDSDSPRGNLLTAGHQHIAFDSATHRNMEKNNTLPARLSPEFRRNPSEIQDQDTGLLESMSSVSTPRLRFSKLTGSRDTHTAAPDSLPDYTPSRSSVRRPDGNEAKIRTPYPRSSSAVTAFPFSISDRRLRFQPGLRAMSLDCRTKHATTEHLIFHTHESSTNKQRAKFPDDTLDE